MSQDPQTPVSENRTPRITRRRLLTAGGALVATGVAGAAGLVVVDRWQRHGRDTTGGIRDHRVQVSSLVPPLVIARGPDPARNVRAVIERLGGLTPFLTHDDVVVIKPNIGWSSTPEQGANTHPDVVAAVVRACLDARPARVIVSDCPVRKSRKAFERSGILAAAQAAGAEVIIPEDSTHRVVRISERLGTWDILEPFVVATKIINVPAAKHHELMGVSAGMKNWIGITNKLRLTFHEDLQRSIAELAALMLPTLTIVDATRILMSGGPEGGSPDNVKKLNTIVASLDPVAVDVWAFAQFGVTTDALPAYLGHAQGMGLGTMDFAALQPVELAAG
ncbi:MAG: DUF362 domain-containing protein [Pseudomonadota bacterium]